MFTICENVERCAHLRKRKVGWKEKSENIRGIYKKITQKDIYMIYYNWHAFVSSIKGKNLNMIADLTSNFRGISVGQFHANLRPEW